MFCRLESFLRGILQKLSISLKETLIQRADCSTRCFPMLLIIIVFFGVSHWFDIRIRYAFDTQLSSLFLWFLAKSHLHIISTDFTVLAVTLRKSIEDVNHLTINSGYCTRLKKKCFTFRNRCDRRIVKQSRFFFCEERTLNRLNQMPRSEGIIFQFLPWHY